MSNETKNNFRLQAKNLFLTYPQCDTSKSLVLTNIRELFGTNLNYAIVCEEDHQPKPGDENIGKHLHCLIQLKERINFRGRKGLKKLDNLADKHGNYKTRKGTEHQAVKYIIKDNNYITWGFLPSFDEWLNAKENKINPISMQIAKAIDDGHDLIDVKEINPGYFMLNQHKILSYYNRNKAIKKSEEIKQLMKDFKPNYYQRLMLKRLDEQNERQITWVIDFEGNKGKTYLAKYLHSQNPDDTLVFTNIRTADALYNYNGQSLIIFDFTRTQNEMVNYSLIEQLKNGLVYSTKYEPIQKHYKSPKILCLSNWEPNQKALSDDRWDIIQLLNVRNIE